MKFIIVLILGLSLNSYAEEKLLCSALVAPMAIKVVKDVQYDKAKHCAVSCILNLYCPTAEVVSVGLIKEIADLLGMGEPDLKDIKANNIGISFSTLGMSKNPSECVELCREYDWRSL